VKGNSIICHGSSNSNAIFNAIRIAVQAVEHNLSQHIGAHFAATAARRG
jgi:fatty acid/phospholipid biosynthesis enzyme